MPIYYEAKALERAIDADALIENHFSDDHRIALSHADKVWMRKIINDAPTLDHKINAHMFGEGTSDRDEAEPPTCFRDVLANQLKALNEATCELTAIMDKLGV